MKSKRKELRNYGIEIESRYFIYRREDRVIAVPYFHIRSVELRENTVVICTSGVEKITIQLPHQGLAFALFEDILLCIERLYLQPPAMAGTIDSTSPSFSSVSRPLRNLMSSSLR